MKIPLPELGLDCEKEFLRPRMTIKCPEEINPKNWPTYSHGYIQGINQRTAENEKSVLVIDEEKYAKELFEICEYPNPEKWEETEEWNREVWRKRASIISQNAKSFMRIEKE